MLRSGEIEGAAVTRALDVIMRNANAQVQLIDDMLDVSRIVTGKMRLDVRPVDLKTVVEAAIDAVAPGRRGQGAPPAEPSWTRRPSGSPATPIASSRSSGIC